MSITTYSELKTAVANWLHRSDLTDRIPEFIALAESRMSRDLAKTRELILRTTTAATTEYHALPSDFQAAVSLVVDTADGKRLNYMPTDQISQKYPNTPSGIPEVFDIVGQYFRIVPVNTNGYTINVTYRAKVPALTDVATTNYILTTHPDLYLWASRLEAADYCGDDRKFQRAQVGYGEVLRSVNRMSFMAGSNPAVRVE